MRVERLIAFEKRLGRFVDQEQDPSYDHVTLSVNLLFLPWTNPGQAWKLTRLVSSLPESVSNKISLHIMEMLEFK